MLTYAGYYLSIISQQLRERGACALAAVMPADVPHLQVVQLVVKIVVSGAGALSQQSCLRAAFFQQTSAYASIRQHTSAYVSIRQHTSAYVSIRSGSSHAC